MKHLQFLLAALITTSAGASTLTLGEDWAIQKNAAATISGLTGTNTSVSFGYTSSATGTGSPGGVALAIPSVTLGADIGNTIELSFSVLVNSSVNQTLNRAFSFGFFQTDGKALINQIGLSTNNSLSEGTNVNLNYRDAGSGGDVFRGKVDGEQVTTGFANFGLTANGIAATDYSFVITRTAEGATVLLNGTNGTDSYESTPLFLSTADADALSFDHIAFGVRNGYKVDTELQWSISNILVSSSTAIPEPATTALLLLGATTLATLALRRRRAARA